MKRKYSIIITAYNKENYIARAIESCIKQVYENIEIIIVNDGSTDKTFKIIKKFNDKRIKKINKENGGVSSARNEGIKEATGEYICFLDGDDWYENNFIYEADKLWNENIDLIIFNRNVVDKNNKYIKDIKLSYENVVLSGKEILLSLNDGKYKIQNCNGNAYKTKIIKNNKLHFCEKIFNGEDFLFNYYYLKYVNNVYYCGNNKCWNYFLSSNSITRSKYSHKIYTAVYADEKIIEDNVDVELNEVFNIFLLVRLFSIISIIINNYRNVYIDDLKEARKLIIKKKKYIKFTQYKYKYLLYVIMPIKISILICKFKNIIIKLIRYMSSSSQIEAK